MESCNNVEKEYDAYIQWIEYSLLMDVREMTSLCNGCTHTTDWLDPKTNESTRVTLKKIVDGQDAQLFDFHQVNYFTTNSIKYMCIAHLTDDCIVYSNS